MGRRTAPTRSTLPSANYTDLGFWKPVTGTELLPNGFNIDQSPSVDDRRHRRPQRRPQRDARLREERDGHDAATRPHTATDQSVIRAVGRQHLALLGRQLDHRAGHVARAQRRDHDEPRPQQGERVLRQQRRRRGAATSPSPRRTSRRSTRRRRARRRRARSRSASSSRSTRSAGRRRTCSTTRSTR